MKTLIVYYSLEENTKRAAEALAEKMDADLLRLRPEKEIPTKGLKKFLMGGKDATAGKGTSLLPFEIQPGAYDRIILGTPVWAGKPAPAVNEFLKTAPKEKILGVFTLSLSGDDKKCIKILQQQCSNLKAHAVLLDARSKKLYPDNARKLDELKDQLSDPV